MSFSGDANQLTPEQHTCLALRPVLLRTADGEGFLDAPELGRVSAGLEYYLPPTLAEIFPYWKGESLDGFHWAEATKLDTEQAEFYGLCILMSDQSVTPLHIHLKLAPVDEEIVWMECRLGERGPDAGGMSRIPWQRWGKNPIKCLTRTKDQVDWIYKFAFGS